MSDTPTEFDELKTFVVEHEDEIISILYLLACERWGKAHISLATSEADRLILTAKKEALEEILERRRRRLDRAAQPSQEPQEGQDR